MVALLDAAQRKKDCRTLLLNAHNVLAPAAAVLKERQRFKLWDTIVAIKDRIRVVGTASGYAQNLFFDADKPPAAAPAVAPQSHVLQAISRDTVQLAQRVLARNPLADISNSDDLSLQADIMNLRRQTPNPLLCSHVVHLWRQSGSALGRQEFANIVEMLCTIHAVNGASHSVACTVPAKVATAAWKRCSTLDKQLAASHRPLASLQKPWRTDNADADADQADADMRCLTLLRCCQTRRVLHFLRCSLLILLQLN